MHVQRPRDRPVRFELRYHAGQVPTVTLDFRSSHFTPMYHATDAIAGCRVTCAVFRDTQMMYLSDKASNYAVRAAQCCTYPGLAPPSASHRTASALHHPTYRSCTPRCKTTLDPYVRARGRTKPPSPRTYHALPVGTLAFDPRRGAHACYAFAASPCTAVQRSSVTDNEDPAP